MPLDPWGNPSMISNFVGDLIVGTQWGICVGSTHTFHIKYLKFAYPGLRIKEIQQEWLLS